MTDTSKQTADRTVATLEPQGLSNMEIDAIGEILNISMGSAATAVSTLLGRKVEITTPTVKVVKTNELSLESLEPAIGIGIEYVEGLNGNNLLVMRRRDIKTIVSLLLGEMPDMDDGELDEIHISAVSEIMNQMMGASATALSSFLGKSINISPPNPFDVSEKMKELNNSEQPIPFVSVKFSLEVEDLLSSEFMTIMPLDFTKELVRSALNFDEVAAETPAVAEKESLAETPAVVEIKTETAIPAAKEIPASKEAAIPKEAPAAQKSPRPAPPSQEKATPVSVKPVRLPSFDEDEAASVGEEASDNFNLILGVPLDVSVEIGRTKMPVKNILEIRQGSIVELDRQAGDPVDVIVNGQLIAKGDVVIIDDNFGVRISEIISRATLPEGIG